MTHCNAGQLATCKYGTATAPIYLGHEKGYNFKVYADETRPLLQGARLTAYELHSAGIDVTLQCDNMSATAMRNGWIQAVFVGCDRVAANGDTANKIGTSVVLDTERGKQLGVISSKFEEDTDKKHIGFYLIGENKDILYNNLGLLFFHHQFENVSFFFVLFNFWACYCF